MLSMLRRAVLGVLLAGALTGCELEPPRTPERANEGWQRLKTDHFDLAIAGELVVNGRAADALPLATKAQLLAPWNPVVLHDYSVTLFAVGRCPDALRVEKRALDQLYDRQSPDVTAIVTKQLADYEKACGTKSAPLSLNP